MSEIKIYTLRLKFDKELSGPQNISLLRGAIANTFSDEILLHQHKEEGVIYRYPLIHYRWHKENGLIVVGFQEGAELLMRLPIVGLSLRLGHNNVNVIDTIGRGSTAIIRPTEKLKRYRFISPWLALNQKLYANYKKMSHFEKAKERDRLVVSSLLMAFRGLDIDIDWQLFGALEETKHRPVSLKDTSLYGIWGTLICNVELPNHLAIGKAVSHGFGWLIDPDKDSTLY